MGAPNFFAEDNIGDSEIMAWCNALTVSETCETSGKRMKYWVCFSVAAVLVFFAHKHGRAYVAQEMMLPPKSMDKG